MVHLPRQIKRALPVLLAVVSAGGLMVQSANEHRVIAAATTQQELKRLTLLAVDQQNRLIDGTRQLMGILVKLPQVSGNDREACERFLQFVLDGDALYTGFGVATLDGNLICSAPLSVDLVNVADRSYFQRTLTSGEFSVGDYQIGRITKKAGVAFGHPIKDEQGRTQKVLIASHDLAWLNKFAEQAELPIGAKLTVVDNAGIILVRHPESELVGMSAPEQKLPITKINLVERGIGVAEVRGDDGIDYLMAFAPIRQEPQTGYLHLILTVPKSTVTAAVDKTLTRNLSGLGVASIFSILLLRFPIL